MKYTPLRDWSCPSYDPDTGRGASAFVTPGTSTTIEGQKIAPNTQMPRRDNASGGARTLAAQDEARTQGPPVKSRPYG
jgi:hypothetical protein